MKAMSTSPTLHPTYLRSTPKLDGSCPFDSFLATRTFVSLEGKEYLSPDRLTTKFTISNGIGRLLVSPTVYDIIVRESQPVEDGSTLLGMDSCPWCLTVPHIKVAAGTPPLVCRVVVVLGKKNRSKCERKECLEKNGDVDRVESKKVPTQVGSSLVDFLRFKERNVTKRWPEDNHCLSHQSPRKKKRVADCNAFGWMQEQCCRLPNIVGKPCLTSCPDNCWD